MCIKYMTFILNKWCIEWENGYVFRKRWRGWNGEICVLFLTVGGEADVGWVRRSNGIEFGSCFLLLLPFFLLVRVYVVLYFF